MCYFDYCFGWLFKWVCRQIRLGLVNSDGDCILRCAIIRTLLGFAGCLLSFLGCLITFVFLVILLVI